MMERGSPVCSVGWVWWQHIFWDEDGTCRYNESYLRPFLNVYLIIPYSFILDSPGYLVVFMLNFACLLGSESPHLICFRDKPGWPPPFLCRFFTHWTIVKIHIDERAVKLEEHRPIYDTHVVSLSEFGVYSTSRNLDLLGRLQRKLYDYGRWVFCVLFAFMSNILSED